MNDRYDLLADYKDQRIKISGVFDRKHSVVHNYRENKTVLLQDVYAHIDGKDLDIGHAWLQNAESLTEFGLVPGDRIQCNCRVKPYKKRLMVPNHQGLMMENRISLCWPTDVVVISRQQSIEIKSVPKPNLVDSVQKIPPQPIVEEIPLSETTVPPNPAKVIREIRRLAQQIGGFDSLQEFIDAIR